MLAVESGSSDPIHSIHTDNLPFADADAAVFIKLTDKNEWKQRMCAPF